MLIVIGKMAYVRDFISSMPVMTLMTVIYGLILDSGRSSPSSALLLLRPNPTNPTHRARSPIPMRSLRSLASSGLSSFVRRYERGYSGRVGGGDKEMWCSKGPQGIVRGQDREDSEALRCT